MAKKLKLMSLFQELEGRAQITNRRPAPAATGVYLMQLRAQTGATTLPRRRMMISVDLPATQGAARPVKIHHIRHAESVPAPQTAPRPAANPPVKAGSLPQVRPDAG